MPDSTVSVILSTQLKKRRYLFHVLLFTACEVEHFLSIVKEYCALCLCLGDVETGSEDSDFRFFDAFDDAFRFSVEYHPPNDLTRGQTSTHNLHYAYIVNVEVFGIQRRNDKGGYSDETGENILGAILL